MAEKKPDGKVLARALRSERPAMQAIRRNLARVSDTADIDAALRALAPLTPSAEYVALANEAAGNPGMGPETVAMMLEDEREIPGTYGRMPLAKKASGRLPVGPAGRTQPSPFAGAQAAGSTTLDPRMLAMALRGGR